MTEHAAVAGRGRADLHIHTLASDGTAGVSAILDHVERRTDLDVIAISDHERIDAAVAARAMAVDRGLRAEVIVGEEVTTLGGHLLALFLDRPIKPYRSLRTSILAVHEAGGLAIPAHPLVPYPLCAQGWILRRLLDDPDPAAHPDGLETFNPTSLGKPWHQRVVRFADQHGLARVGNSDAHALEAIGTGWTTFPGHGAADLRLAIETRTSDHGGSFHATAGQLGTFGQQLRKRGRDARAEVAGRVRRDGTGRDHGYPGGHRRPPRYETGETARPGTSHDAGKAAGR
jgi:predicted metal-dependent phosphoesterase TrpH